MNVRNLQLLEEYSTMDRWIKYIDGKFRKSVTTFVTQQKTESSTLEITIKTPLEKVIIAENVKNYHQTKLSCPLLDNPPL